MANHYVKAMPRLVDLPFTSFGDLDAYDLEVAIACRCGRTAVFNGQTVGPRGETLFNRIIMGARFTCSTVLPDGNRCRGLIVPKIRRRGREGWTLDDHVRALWARHPDADRKSTASGLKGMVARGEVAFLWCLTCQPMYEIDFVAFDEPPWDRYLRLESDVRFRCPACRKALGMHVHGFSNLREEKAG